MCREKLNAYNQPSGPPARRDDRRDDRRGGGGDDPRKRSQRGDRGGDRSGGGGGQSEDGWQVGDFSNFTISAGVYIMQYTVVVAAGGYNELRIMVKIATKKRGCNCKR